MRLGNQRLQQASQEFKQFLRIRIYPDTETLLMTIDRAAKLSNRTAGTVAQARKGGRTKKVGRPQVGTVEVDAEAAILRASLALFPGLGYTAVSTKEIAAAAELNPALIYYYYGSKDELFRRTLLLALEEASAPFQLLAAKASNGKRGAEAFLLDWLRCHEAEFSKVRRLLQITLSYTSSPAKDDAVDRALRDFYDGMTRLLTTTMNAGIKYRELPPMDVRQTSTFILSFLDGVYTRSIVFSDYKPASDLADLRRFIRERFAAVEG